MTTVVVVAVLVGSALTGTLLGLGLRYLRRANGDEASRPNGRGSTRRAVGVAMVRGERLSRGNVGKLAAGVFVGVLMGYVRAEETGDWTFVYGGGLIGATLSLVYIFLRELVHLVQRRGG